MDLEGNTYNRLKVIGFYEMKRYDSANHHQTKSIWVCECACKNVCLVPGEALRDGRIKSCGCYAKEVHAKRMKKLNRTHGLSNTPEYRSYASMIARVINPTTDRGDSYTGVTICKRWLGKDGMKNFLKDMGKKPTPRHEIDREDPYGDYEPENCRWATRQEQMINQRRNYKIYAEYKSLSPVVPYSMYRQRLRTGWDKNKAATHPKMKNQFL